jgi:hypothetical protein
MVTGLERTNVLDLAVPENVIRTMNLRLQIIAEPKVEIVRRGNVVQLQEAVDEHGNSLLPESPRIRSRVGLSPGSSLWSVDVPLHYPANAGQRIARIRGSIVVGVQTRPETMEFDEIMTARDVTRTAGEQRFEFNELRKVGEDQFHAIVTIHAVPANRQQEGVSIFSRPDTTLLDAHGRAYAYGNYQPQSISANQATMRITFNRSANAGEPAKLVWAVPVETQDIELNFMFTNLPLP